MAQSRAKEVKARIKGFTRAFCTKAQACRKLQITIKEFRRLCILKGIYPRHPKKIPSVAIKKGLKKNSTFYFTRDINWLLQEPILEKFREFSTYNKKLKKRIAKGQGVKGKAYKDEVKPQLEYSLVPLLKERYPTFLEAVREMSDALSHMFLYSILPPHIASKTTIEGHNYLTTRLSKKSRNLAKRWTEYCANTSAVRKAFISIKGWYYQADIMGQAVTWLVPHNYNVMMPGTVDYNVMMTFLEFYTVMLDFVLFRLESEYKANESRVKLEQEKDEEREELGIEDMAEDFPMSPEDQKTQEAQKKLSGMFAGFTFFLGTEVPHKNLVFVIKSLGGKIEQTADHKSVTHVVMDRPAVKGTVRTDCDYVQPQWILDCLNAKHLLPVDQYGPGKELPPHLSPFDEGLVADHDGRPYEPSRLKEIRNLMEPTFKALAAPDSDEEKESDALSDSELEELSEPEAKKPSDGIVTDDEDETDTEAEDTGPKKKERPAPHEPKPVEPKKKKELTPKQKQKALKILEKRKEKKELKEKKMRALMLSNKKRKLWQRISKAQARQDNKVNMLDEKRKKLEAGKLKVAADGYIFDPKAKKRSKFNPKRKQKQEQKDNTKKATKNKERAKKGSKKD
jgi:pescadillo protein|uniref:Pescadillo homolog n=1 Tax=Eutreptiella gymnastica TaxID=73025 RepID=A0A7S4GH27_9EUGL|mmetsp:Transcript_14178/g.23669  ORF Transcript_14178/g.23669 Transcript_14178/m.23669 type:complete len:623 (+) Transcript_14178:51-1919(+)|eukprot:CAMPEP_0174285226 /NCGR_PEP_ID=MMETSP0809-20121228/8109_1 /TAXON_ID=73025 ORGANISM="Eutreptiella gymnastica-like, Strain CCMP1594" /NCGR_SAMPLE_ID=MMETSP0809 /ASSEMBLY_ACC=CAM_ASM_000658 /LENGTH=622 /DNA_ID=CAMNT_0015380939 /DNA_START=48 /DNA_END=1916 /DNA_ORIENTATION=-